MLLWGTATALVVLFVYTYSVSVASIISKRIGLNISVNNAQAQEVNPDLTPEQEEKLRKELERVEAEIKAQQVILGQKQGEGQSISRDIAILDAKIKQAQLKIQAHDIAIQRLGKDITVKTKTIETLSEKISKNKATMAQILNNTDQLESYSLPEALLTKKSITEFFIDIDTYASFRNSLQNLLYEVSEDKNETEVQKVQLDSKRDAEMDAKVDVQAEQRSIKANEAEKKRLLALNKQEQAGYQAVIAEKQKKANEIRNALFKLRDAESIKFGDALAYAKAVSKATGVRPAFLLAVITQESNLGANVGSCYLTDTTTGAGIKVVSGIATANVMKPTRDVQPFLNITKALGRDPFKTRVSCPFTIGYGGAMGPAQFIPSTWVLFQTRVQNALGKTAADPWNPQDAFMASGMYLTDLGAGAQTYSAERNAACKYYSGSACTASSAFYGDQVLAKATNIQETMINVLDGN